MKAASDGPDSRPLPPRVAWLLPGAPLAADDPDRSAAARRARRISEWPASPPPRYIRRPSPASLFRELLSPDRSCAECCAGSAPENRAGPPQSKEPRASRHIFFFNDTATTEIYTLSLHDALPI